MDRADPMPRPPILDYARPTPPPGRHHHVWQGILGFVSGLLVFYSVSFLLAVLLPATTPVPLAVTITVALIVGETMIAVNIVRKRVGLKRSYWIGFCGWGVFALVVVPLTYVVLNVR